jgi:hypothetical protein
MTLPAPAPVAANGGRLADLLDEKILKSRIVEHISQLLAQLAEHS